MLGIWNPASLISYRYTLGQKCVKKIYFSHRPIGNRAIDLIDNLQLISTNVLTKKSSTFQIIISVENKGQPMEVKDLAKETLSKEKALMLNKLFEISDSSDISTICTLSTLITKFYSFTFYPIKVLDILLELD